MRSALAGLAVTLGLVGSAQAHHSAAAFDRSKPYTMLGTVKEFIWANPHAWIHVLVPNDAGGQDEYTLEGPGISNMARNGWTRRTLQAGDAVKIVTAPRRDGSMGGEFMAVFKDGKQLKF